jgi:glycosyltransferase involved in cell wall biosynthesis
MKILVSAYSCEPYRGSEPGVGWNFSMALASRHNVFVITRSNQKKQIEDFILKNDKPNIKFIYYDLPWGFVKLERILGAQFYYILWQLFAYFTVKVIIKKEKIDLIHHLTFNQYRTPSWGFFFNIPFVFGPVGGAELINDIVKSELSRSTKMRERFRKNKIGLKTFSFLSKLTPSPKAFLFSANENKERIEKYIKSKKSIVDVIPAIGIDKKDFTFCKNNNNKEFTLAYAGRAEDWKGIHLFLDALRIYKANNFLFNVKLIGIRAEIERIKILNWVNEFELNDFIEIIDFMPRNDLMELLSSADLFVYPAFRDSGSMSVLEACALACPTICFDAGGQDIFPHDIIIKIPIIDSYNKTKRLFADKLVWAYENRAILKDIGQNAQNYVYREFAWDEKVNKIELLYNKLLNNK